MSKARPISVLSSGVAVALIVAGCGGEGETLTKAEFIKETDAICAKVHKQVESAIQVRVKENKDADYVEIAKTIVFPALQREAEEIQDLGAPNGEEDKVAKIVEAIEKDVDLAEKDPETLNSFSGGALITASKVADDYGLEGCARVF